MPPKKEKDPSTRDPPSTPSPYALHARVLCSHNDDHYYEAKIIAVEQDVGEEPVYTVHYQGWNQVRLQSHWTFARPLQRHDEKIPHAQTITRFKPYTPENVEKARVSP